MYVCCMYLCTVCTVIVYIQYYSMCVYVCVYCMYVLPMACTMASTVAAFATFTLLVWALDVQPVTG